MNKFCTVSLFIFLLFLATNVQAQQISESSVMPSLLSYSSDYSQTAASNVIVTDSSDTTSLWKVNWIGGLHGSQASYSNWSSGGVNSVSVTASTLFDALYQKNKWGYHLEINLRYGRTRLDDQGNRKTDDEISILNKATYDFSNEHWHAFGLVNFESQFDQGFNYDVPAGQDPELISEFFAPAYVSEAIGVGYEPTDYFTAGAGFKLKETIVTNDLLTTQYGLAPGDNFLLEPGLTIRLSLEKSFSKMLN